MSEAVAESKEAEVIEFPKAEAEEEQPKINLDDRDMVCIWTMTEAFKPNNGTETDAVAALRAKIRPLVAKVMERARGRRE